MRTVTEVQEALAIQGMDITPYGIFRMAWEWHYGPRVGVDEQRLEQDFVDWYLYGEMPVYLETYLTQCSPAGMPGVLVC